MSDNRDSLLTGLWFFSAVVLVALFISAAAQGVLTPAHVALAAVILAVAIGGTPYLLRVSSQEKSKQRGVDSLLHEMNDADLMELKQRLSDLDSDRVKVLDRVGDDGEMVWRE